MFKGDSIIFVDASIVLLGEGKMFEGDSIVLLR